MEETFLSPSPPFLSAQQSPTSNDSYFSSSDLIIPTPFFNDTPNQEPEKPESSSKNAIAWYCNVSDAILMPSSKIRSCDVYIGLHGREPALLRFVNWLRAELELHGVSCFVADWSRCRDVMDRYMVENAMQAATLGVMIVTKRSFSSPYSIKELRCFLGRKNLVPIFFGLSSEDCLVRDGEELWKSYGGEEKDPRDAIDGLLKVGSELKLRANVGNWRDCISNAVTLLGLRLGRRCVIERDKEMVGKDEFPFHRNTNFVGRKKEILELELMLFGDVAGGNAENECFELEKRVDEGEEEEEEEEKINEAVIWKESEEEIEMEGIEGLSSHYLVPKGRKRSAYGKGIACVSGNSGIGKTELLLEFAYRFSQRYKMVLWVGGESRYICENYMNLLPVLGVDLSAEKLCSERDKPRSFKELEEDAFRRVRKELMRDIPFLVVIDNLESEKDWWNRKNVMDLLPRFGGETHIIISTRLPRILNMEPLKLSYLSDVESLSLMKGTLQDLPMAEIEALKAMEEKLGRITLGLALVGAILSNFSIHPTRLLDTINRMPLRDLKWGGREDPFLRRNPFLVQLFDVCFSMFDRELGPRSLPTRMVLASGWFAPSSIPVPLLALAASEIVKDGRGSCLWKRLLHAVRTGCFSSNLKKSEDEASSMLVRFKIARSSTKHGCILIHEIFKLYARRRGGIGAANAMVRAISSTGSIPQDSMHIWAGCFLLFKFGTDPSLVELKVSEFLSFIEQLALPLAVHTYTNLLRFKASKELLQLCLESLEVVEEEVEKSLEKSMRWTFSNQSNTQLNPIIYRELSLLKANLLETSVELMLKGGEYELAEGLCRKAISIRNVFCGWNDSSTISAQETMDKIIRLQAYTGSY